MCGHVARVVTGLQCALLAKITASVQHPRGVRERLGGGSAEASRFSSADQHVETELITNSSQYRQYRV